MRPRRKDSHKVCGQCGRRCRYVWRMGGGRRCRGCVVRAGIRVVYPSQVLLRFPGRLPLMEAS